MPIDLRGVADGTRSWIEPGQQLREI